jgi:D-amino-acid dehydrogenase
MTGRNVEPVAIVGGGLVGWSVAYRLGETGVSAFVVDRADEGFATQAGAGMIVPGTNLHSPEPFFALARGAMRHYPAFIADLEANGPIDTGFRIVGSLFIAREEAEAERLPGIADVIEARRDHGLGMIGNVSFVDAAAARERIPVLADIPLAIHVEQAARVDGKKLREALRTASLSRGIAEVDGSADLRRAGDRVRLLINGVPADAATVVLAGGAWSGDLGSQCGLDLPVTPQRGQIVHMRARNHRTGAWPIVEGFHSHYLVTFEPDRVVCGATRETGAGFDPRITAGGLREVLDHALRIAPGLFDAAIVETRVGLRPLTPDLLPILGRAGPIENLYLCTGHGPTGLQLGPWSGALVADLLVGREPETDLSPFAAQRFAGTSTSARHDGPGRDRRGESL